MSVIPFPGNLRRHDRLPVVDDFAVYDYRKPQLLGRLVNIHTEGLLLHTSKLLPLSTPHLITIDADSILSDACAIKLEVEFIWQQKTANNQFWVGGFFLQCEPSSVSCLKELIEYLKHRAE